MIAELFSIYLRMLVLYSPFFVLSCFISMTRGYAPRERKHLAWRVATGVLIASLLLYLFGRYIFDLFGITIDAFRIGAGSVLFISALGMAQGKAVAQSDNVHQDVTIVPLTIPLLTGPATISTMVIYSQQTTQWWQVGVLMGYGLVIGAAAFLALSAAGRIARLLGQTGINVMTRLMGLILAALAVEIMADGLQKLFPALGGAT